MTCPVMSPLFTFCTCPFRIMFIISYPCNVRPAAGNEKKPFPGLTGRLMKLASGKLLPSFCSLCVSDVASLAFLLQCQRKRRSLRLFKQAMSIFHQKCARPSLIRVDVNSANSPVRFTLIGTSTKPRSPAICRNLFQP